MELAYYLNKVKHYFVHHIRIHFFSLRIAEETIQSIKEKEKRDAKKVKSSIKNCAWWHEPKNF